MRNARRFLGLLAVTLSVTLGATGQGPPRPEILIVGTFHLANRNHDLYNVQADDVLSPKRQSEISQVIEILKKFRPTKIAIEADIDNQSVAANYADYLAGKYTLSRDETNQFGYRLAHELGQKQVYPVNAWAGDDFPLARLRDYAKAHSQDQQLEAILAKWGTLVNGLDDYLKSHTILETLERANSDDFVGQDVAPYYEAARLGAPADYAGPDLLGNWYLRNIRIYHNIVSLIDSPGDRILVVYGYGHLGALRQDAQSDPTVRLRTLSEFAR